MFLELVFMFLAVYGFSIIFNVPKSELFYCCILGTVSWFFYLITLTIIDSTLYAVAIASFSGTYLSKKLTYIRKMPLTVFVIPAILPMAPGYLIYNAMHSAINNPTMTISYILEAFKSAGAIGLGMSLAMPIPTKFFIYKKKNNLQ